MLIQNKEKSIYIIEKKFPQYQAEIERLFRQSNLFRELCTDYMDIENMLNYWRQSEQQPDDLIIKEYQTLLGELEN